MISAIVRPAGLYLLVTVLHLTPATSGSQCLTPELVLINSCIEHPNPNGGPVEVESELIIVRTGLVPVPVSTIGVDLPFNGFGAENADVGHDLDGNFYGCNFKQPTITTLPGCPGAIPAGPDDVIPANAFVVIFFTGTTVTEDVNGTDFSNICSTGQAVYILQSGCERTTGAFANGPGQGDPLRRILVSSPCGPRIFTYNTAELNPQDGTFYLVGTNETDNQDCALPIIPPGCAPIDTVHYLCGYGDTVDPPVPVSEFEVLFPPNILVISFHRSPEDAELNRNAITGYSGPTDEPDTLFSRVIYSDNLCTAIAALIIRFPDDSFQTMIPAEPVRGCDPLSTGTGVFNLRLSDPEVGGGGPVTWYLDPGLSQEISDPENFISPATTVFAVAGLGVCAGSPVPVPLGLSTGPTINSFFVDSTSCPGVSDGRIGSSVSGYGPFVDDWDIDEYDGSASISGLAPGPYNFIVTDRYGCSTAMAFEVYEGLPPQIECAAIQGTAGPAEATGVARITLGRGEGPYQLVYFGADAGAVEVTEETFDLTGLLPGDYSVAFTDVNGCSSDTCTFSIPTLTCNLSLTAEIDTIVCAERPEGGIFLTMTGGAAPFRFTWASGVAGDSSGVSVFAEGTYAVRIDDAAGCRLDTAFFVPNLMRQADLLLETPSYLPACPGEDVRIPVEFVGAAPFTLEYIVSPAPGVDSFRTFTTSQHFDTLVIPAADFIDDGLQVSSRRLTDERCESQLNQTINVEYSRQDTIRRRESTCRTDPIEIGGRFFDVQNPSDTFRFDDGSTCGVIYEVDLDFQEGIVPDTVIVPVCPATPYEVNGEVFDANRPEGVVTYSRPGICDSLVYVRLDILPEYIGRFSDNACAGDTIFYADRFFTAENTSGLARLPGMAATGCDSLVFVTTSFRRTGEVRLFGDFEVCPGDPIELRFTYDGPGSIDVRLTDLAGNISDLSGIRQGSRVELFPTESTSYRLLSSGIGGCPGEVAGASSVVVNDLSIGTEVLLDPGDYCQDTLGLAAVSYTGGSGPYEVEWSNGPSDSINRNLLAGTYVVSVTDAVGCTLTDSVTLNLLEPLTARVTGLPPVCPGESGSLRIDTIFGGGGFYEVSIDGQFFLPAERMADIRVPVGNHRAIFQGANDCSVGVNFTVRDALRPNFGLPVDTTIFLGDSIFLDASLLNQDSAWWTPSTFLSDPNSAATWAAPLSSTTLTLHLRTLAQCLFTQEVRITVDERLPVYAPTAFSPNGDNFNDLYALALGRNVRALRSFQIFNRWGNLMYDGVDGWDGEFSGKPAPPAVYVFYAVVEMADGSERFVKGDFVLMR